jgi:hypothetical protein
MHKRKVYTTTIMAFLMIAVLLSTVLLARAAPGISVNPTSGMPDDSVEVTGTDFAASSPVGIGMGAEINQTDTDMAFAGTSVGPYYGKTSYWPIKPGSFVLKADTTMSGGLLSTYTDNGNGTLSGSFEGAYGDINYTTGEWSRTSTADLTGMEQLNSANYIRYEWNVTSAGGLTTEPDGSFTTNITVAQVANGSSPITAIDEEGNLATADFTVYGSDVPEIFSVGVVVLLTSAAVVIATFSLRKRVKPTKPV